MSSGHRSERSLRQNVHQPYFVYNTSAPGSPVCVGRRYPLDDIEAMDTDRTRAQLSGTFTRPYALRYVACTVYSTALS